MHSKLEVILAPNLDVEKTVEEVMAPFDENASDSEEYSGHGFWDWYVIGGRFSGDKLLAGYDQDKLKKFYELLSERKVTVSGVICGKETLQPESQRGMVDALWNEWFPPEDGVPVACPLFDHSPKVLSSDIAPLCNCLDMTAHAVLVVGPKWTGEGVEASFLIHRNVWNGVVYLDVDWDGKIGSAVEKCKKRLGNAKPDFAAARMPQDDWLCVTVDYHS